MAENQTPGYAIDRLEVRIMVAEALIRGIRGTGRFTWGSGEASSYAQIARSLGYPLVTKTAAARDGHALKRGVKPVGSVYFNAPISTYADVYVKGVQTRPKNEGEEMAIGIADPPAEDLDALGAVA